MAFKTMFKKLIITPLNIGDYQLSLLGFYNSGPGFLRGGGLCDERGLKSLKYWAQFLVASLLFLLMTSSLSGCSAILTSVSSHPVNLPQNAESKKNGVFVLKWPDLEVSIQVQNDPSGVAVAQFLMVPIFPVWVHEHHDYLRIWLNVKPNEEGFSVDPRKIFVKNEDDIIVPVNRYYGPCDPYLSSRGTWYTCGRLTTTINGIKYIARSEEGDAKIPLVPIAIPYSRDSKGKSLFLEFDTESSPEHSIALSIKGIYKDKEKYTIPEICFKRGRNWDMLPIP